MLENYKVTLVLRCSFLRAVGAIVDEPDSTFCTSFSRCQIRIPTKAQTSEQQPAVSSLKHHVRKFKCKISADGFMPAGLNL